MRLLSRMNNGQAQGLAAHSSTSGTRAVPLSVGYVSGGKVFSLISGLPSALSVDRCLSLFECFIGTIPLSDSSGTYTRAVWPEPSPTDLLSGCTAGVSEVSRFSCRKFLGVFWGLRLRRTDRELALSPPFLLPSAHYKNVGVRVASFRSSIAQPTYPPVYASPCTSRYATQNSGPSGSLVLARRASSTPASYRFIPAHCNSE
jgi:hypothetical protein